MEGCAGEGFAAGGESDAGQIDGPGTVGAEGIRVDAGVVEGAGAESFEAFAPGQLALPARGERARVAADGTEIDAQARAPEGAGRDPGGVGGAGQRLHADHDVVSARGSGSAQEDIAGRRE